MLVEGLGFRRGDPEPGGDHPPGQGRAKRLDQIATSGVLETVEQLLGDRLEQRLQDVRRRELERPGDEPAEARVGGSVEVEERCAAEDRGRPVQALGPQQLLRAVVAAHQSRISQHRPRRRVAGDQPDSRLRPSDGGHLPQPPVQGIGIPATLGCGQGSAHLRGQFLGVRDLLAHDGDLDVPEGGPQHGKARADGPVRGPIR